MTDAVQPAKILRKLGFFVWRHRLGIIAWIALGQCFPLLIFPYLLDSSWFQDILVIHRGPSITLQAFVLIFFILALFRSCEISSEFVHRYRNTWKHMGEVPFTYFEGVALFTLSLGTSLFHTNILGRIHQSIIPLIILMGLGLAIWLLVVLLKGSKEPIALIPQVKKAVEGDFFPDEPITNDQEDILDRGQFVEGLYKRLTNPDFPLQHFVYGLYGAWGEGKTSVINLLKNRLYGNDNVILFEFDPWHFSSPEALVTSFYQGLNSSITRNLFLPNIRASFKKYWRILSAALKVTGIEFDVTVDPLTLEDLKTSIQRQMILIQKRIIIIIDNLDRLLSKKDILEVFKIISLSGRFKRTSFLVSFDPSQVISQLKVDLSFLEKIIQCPLNIPRIEKCSIDRLLYYSSPEKKQYSGIDQLFIRLNIEEERIEQFETQFGNIYERFFSKYFSTIRHVKRYLNSLYSTLPSIKEEVNLFDFCVLDLIRIYHPDVYEDIRTHPWFYWASKWDTRATLLSPLAFLDDKDKNQKIRDHLDQITSGKPERDVLLDLLSEIFFVEVKHARENKTVGYSDTQKYRAAKRITHPEVFPKYFMLKVSAEDIPDERVESSIRTWNKSAQDWRDETFLKELTDFQNLGLLRDFLEKIRVFLKKLEPDASRNIISSISKKIGLFSTEGAENLWQSEFDSAIVLLMNLLEENIEDGQKESVLINIIEQTPSLELPARIYHYRRMDESHGFYRINRSTNQEIISQSFSEKLKVELLDKGRDIFQEESNPNRILIEWFNQGSTSSIEMNQYVYRLLEKNPKYVFRIMKAFIPVGMDGRITRREMNYDGLKRMYDAKKLYEHVIKFRGHPLDEQESTLRDLFLAEYEKENTSTPLRDK